MQKAATSTSCPSANSTSELWQDASHAMGSLSVSSVHTADQTLPDKYCTTNSENKCHNTCTGVPHPSEYVLTCVKNSARYCNEDFYGFQASSSYTQVSGGSSCKKLGQESSENLVRKDNREDNFFGNIKKLQYTDQEIRPAVNKRRSSDQKYQRDCHAATESLRKIRNWTLREGLGEWARSTEKFIYGCGNKAVILERDADPGVWKVAPGLGDRFSRHWLKGLSEWISFYRSAKLLQTSSKLNSCYGVASAAQENFYRIMQESQIGARLCTIKTSDTSNHPLRSIEDGPYLTHSAKSQYLKIKPLSQRAISAAKTSEPVCGVSSCDLENSISDIARALHDPTDDSETIPAVPKSESQCQWKLGSSALQGGCTKSDMIYVSVHCEKMDMTDRELEMLAVWLQEHKDYVHCTKLWLFDNKITDQGAQSIMKMMHDGLKELHLSHNSLTNSAAESIISCISTSSTTRKPLWLRMEWNMLNVDSLLRFLEVQKDERGLVIDIPKFQLKRIKGKMTSQLIQENTNAHAQVPWIRSQRLKPSEAPVLVKARSSWSRLMASYHQDPSNLSKTHSSGPLLVFPDTSALLGLIGISRKGQKPSTLTFDWLQSLCMKGHFGRSLPSNQRVYFILCDSVAKQLDGLKKQTPYVGYSIRKLMSSGLDQFGPAGEDFVTVLGAHEGEGMVVDRNADVLDSRSRNVHNKGQATDLKIIEVALFFQQELFKRSHGDPNHPRNEPKSGPDSNPVQTPPAQQFPVLLLSNDNVQLRASKSHGLPAYRFTDLGNQKQLLWRFRSEPLTASAFREMTACSTQGLGESARKSLQGEFDGAVACVRHLVECYEGLSRRFDQYRRLSGGTIESVQENSESFCKKTVSKKSVAAGSDAGKRMDVRNTVGLEEVTASGDNSSCKENDMDIQHAEFVELVKTKLREWEGLVKSYQNPSRVLRWVSHELKRE